MHSNAYGRMYVRTCVHMRKFVPNAEAVKSTFFTSSLNNSSNNNTLNSTFLSQSINWRQEKKEEEEEKEGKEEKEEKEEEEKCGLHVPIFTSV